MKQIFTFCLITLCAISLSNAQTIEENLAMKQAELAEAQAVVDGILADVNELKKTIEINAGWQRGFSTVAGLNLNRSSNWAGNANPNGQSSALTISGTGYANKIGERGFWRNTGIVNLGWQKVDPDHTIDGDETGFDRNVDLLNLSSLAGHRLSEVFALTGLADLTSSVGNFLSPGTVDLGIGGTYTGIDKLVIVFHPLNGRIAFPADATGLDTKTFFGMKIRADYANQFANGVAWSTNATIFSPYSGEFMTTDGQMISAFEWTWLNTVTFPVWQGLGLGVSFGLRDAAFEFDGVQSFYTIGLSYTL